MLSIKELNRAGKLSYKSGPNDFKKQAVNGKKWLRFKKPAEAFTKNIETVIDETPITNIKSVTCSRS